jgi:2-dehydro-3-deoxy-D-arabinonate dehydratase
MKLGQIHWDGHTVAAIFEQGGARPIPDYTLFDLVHRADNEKVQLSTLAERLASRHLEQSEPLLPITPKEVWACGCTYEMSASFRDAEHNTREGFYRHVFLAENRPEIFFKGTARVCSAPGQAIGIRKDSQFTAPEPELAVLLGKKGRIHGYTIANDVSAWDIERENPLYLPQSKTYCKCCSFGPWFVTADAIADPYALEMTCTIERAGSVIFSGSVSTGKLNRKIETLVEYLVRSNMIPAGTILLTGTGIIVPQEAALAPGDVVTISVPEIGTLVNQAQIVS